PEVAQHSDRALVALIALYTVKSSHSMRCKYISGFDVCHFHHVSSQREFSSLPQSSTCCEKRIMQPARNFRNSAFVLISGKFHSGEPRARLRVRKSETLGT